MKTQIKKQILRFTLAATATALLARPVSAGILYANGTQPAPGGGTSGVAASDGQVYDVGNWELWVGGTPWLNGSTTPESSPIYAFQLPSLGNTSDPFASATLGLTFYAKDGTPTFNVDLYGLGVSASPTVVAGDYYSGSGDGAPGVTLLESSLLTPSTSMTSADHANNVFSTDLSAYLNAAYASGANAGDYVIVRLSPSQAGISSDVNYHIESNPGNGTPADLPQISFTLTPVPEPSTFALCSLAGMVTLFSLRNRRR
jgi:hypothetical protein